MRHKLSALTAKVMHHWPAFTHVVPNVANGTQTEQAKAFVMDTQRVSRRLKQKTQKENGTKKKARKGKVVRQDRDLDGVEMGGTK